MNINRSDLRKKGACIDGREDFCHVFPKGITEFTFDNALKVVKFVPDSHIAWFLAHYINPRVAAAYYRMLDRAADRAYNDTDWDKEDVKLARWLLKTVQKHLGGDA